MVFSVSSKGLIFYILVFRKLISFGHHSHIVILACGKDQQAGTLGFKAAGAAGVKKKNTEMLRVSLKEEQQLRVALRWG